MTMTTTSTAGRKRKATHMHNDCGMLALSRVASGRKVQTRNNPAGYCVVLPDGKLDCLVCTIRLAVALAKSQDHRASCGVFAFGLPNAVRRWLGTRYPATRANQSRGGGLRIEPGGRVFDLQVCSAQAMAWLRRASIEAQRNLVLTRYKLRFAPTFTKEQL